MVLYVGCEKPIKWVYQWIRIFFFPLKSSNSCFRSNKTSKAQISIRAALREALHLLAFSPEVLSSSLPCPCSPGSFTNKLFCLQQQQNEYQEEGFWGILITAFRNTDRPSCALLSVPFISEAGRASERVSRELALIC